MPRETGKNGYKAKLVKKLNERFPECIIYHNDPNQTHQGIPDITIIDGPFWGMLEVKAAANSPQQPNQDHWVEYYNQKSFAAFIYPANEEEVLNALQAALAPFGDARNTQS